MNPDHRPHPAMTLPGLERAVRQHGVVAPVNPAYRGSRRGRPSSTQFTLRSVGSIRRASHLSLSSHGTDTVASS